MSTLHELLARVEAAKGANLKLECDIAETLGVSRTETSRSGLRLQDTPPPYTASLDAAVALVERMLPGHAAAIGTMLFNPPGTPWATIWTPQGEPKFHGHAPTPALALIDALLRALIAKGDA